MDIWATLTCGATLYLKPPGVVAGTELSKYLRDNKINFFLVTPSVLSTLSGESLPDLKVINVGGENCPVVLMQEFAKTSKFIVGYGPTECTVACTARTSLASDMFINLGRPLPNYFVYILDEKLQPVPIGVPGELCIGGMGVGRGYIHNEALTNSKYVPNPYASGRIYKTGDIARFLSNGEIEFIGRKDFQVKLRGLRIELEEIETVIIQAPGVRNAAVLVRHDDPNPQVLVGYLSPCDVDTPTVEHFATARLPAYMVPQVWVTLDSLPLSINGKIDRKALPVPNYSAGSEIVAPRSDTEKLLVTIWAEVLGLPEEKIGVETSFFTLGGHSLLATQVVARINGRMRINLNVRSMFEYPRIAEFSVHANAAQPSESDLESEAITPVPRDQAAGLTLMPTSFAQERLWVTEQLNTAASLYNSTFLAKMKTTPDIPKLQEAVQQLAMRHEVLRTSIANVHGKSTQVIHPTVHVPFKVVALGSSIYAEQFMNQERVKPFDLMKDAMIRCTVVTLKSGECYVLFCMHHIVTDGWSLGIILKEVNSFYNQQALPPLSIQYADFAVWHRKVLSGDNYEQLKQYWMKKLEGELPTLELPLDYPRPKIMSHKGASIFLKVDSKLTSSIRALATAHQCTTYVVLLATFQTLLHRYTSLEDIIVGTTFANRTNKQVEELIGFFVNTVAMRTDFSGAPTFAEILKRVRTTALEAYEHQDMPFEENVSNLKVARSLGTSPIFQVMLTYQNSPFSSGTLCGQEFEVVEDDALMSKFDMTLSVEEGEAQMLVNLVYACDLYNAESAQRIINHFGCLLQSVCSDSDLLVSQLAMMEETEQKKIVEQWNRTEAPFPSDKCVHQLFSEQAASHPHKIALVWNFGKNSLTFKEVDERGTQLACYLQQLGIGSEDLVGLCVEQSQWMMIIGMLGIWKAGGAYVSLDPKLPAERLRYMMDSAKMPVVLTQSNLIEKLPPNQSARIITLDTVWDDVIKVAASQQLSFEACASSHNLAYVLFTSGSTGLPKGVMIEHRGLTNLVTSMAPALKMDTRGRTLQNPAYTFDMSLKDIWITLLVGAELHLKPAEVIAGPDLAKYLRDHKITYLFGTPTVLTTIAAEPLPDLEMINSAGEACSVSLMQQLSPGRRFLVTYGPTECTVSTTVNVCCTGEPGATLTAHPAATIIGRPLANYTVYIVDKELKPVPLGTPGEIVIGGVGIARGYLHNPELTAAKFIPNPFGEGKLYMSGDIGRFRENGEIEFIGRKDFQVKLRGLRIELGEIEAVLAMYPGIKSTAALVRTDEPGRPLLVAYVAPADVNVAGLLAHAASRLPHYMVPYVVVRLDSLPVNNNGKIDRNALPPPPKVEADEIVAPQTVVEISIADMWSRVLGISYDKIGLDMNFFELGGTSLLVVSLVTLIRKELDPTVSVVEAFLRPTVREMAAMVAQPSSAPITSLAELVEIEAKLLVFGVAAPSQVDKRQMRLSILSSPAFSHPLCNSPRSPSNSTPNSPHTPHSPPSTSPRSATSSPRFPFKFSKRRFSLIIPPSSPSETSPQASPVTTPQTFNSPSFVGKRKFSLVVPSSPSPPLGASTPALTPVCSTIASSPMAPDFRSTHNMEENSSSAASPDSETLETKEIDEGVALSVEEYSKGVPPFHPLAVLLRQMIGIILVAAAISGSFMGGIFLAFYVAQVMGIRLIYTSPLIYFVSALLNLLVLVAFKWLFVGKQKPRLYRIWSWQFISWWVVEHLHQFVARQFLYHLTGTPLIIFYYRCLGAKIGKGVCIDTELISNPDLITIGDHVCIGRQALLRTHVHKDGLVLLERVTIHDQCTVGDMSVLQPTSIMYTGSFLAPFSLLTENHFLPANTMWEGSPAKYVREADSAATHNHSFLGVLFSIFGLLWLFASLIISLVPFLYLTSYFLDKYGSVIGSCITPVGLALSLVLQGTFLLVSKWIVLGKLKEGTYPLFGSYYYRRWFANRMMMLDPITAYLSGTIVAAAWLRLWGAQIGHNISTAVMLDRDMLRIGDGVFLAENVTEACGVVQAGSLSIKKVTIGDYTFIGNTSYIAGGTTIEDNCTVGALTCLANESYPSQTTWVGAPPIHISENKDALENEALGNVSKWKRVLVDLLGFPYLLVVNAIFQLPAVLIIAELGKFLPFIQLRALSPYFAALSFVSLFIITFTIKWVTGKQTPETAYHHLSIISNYFDKNVDIDTMGLADWDLLNIGDDVVISYHAHLQGHTAENNIFKFRAVNIGNRCNVGAGSVVLPGVVVEDGVSLAPLTLAMKGENFSLFNSVYGDSTWEGSPARACKEPPFVLRNNEFSSSKIELNKEERKDENKDIKTKDCSLPMEHQLQVVEKATTQDGASFHNDLDDFKWKKEAPLSPPTKKGISTSFIDLDSVVVV